MESLEFLVILIFKCGLPKNVHFFESCLTTRIEEFWNLFNRPFNTNSVVKANVHGSNDISAS